MMSSKALVAINNENIEKALIGGDLAPLSTEDRLQYYTKVCDSVGLNPLTKPFLYIKLNGKLQLYAAKDCTDQLRKIHNISIEITDTRIVEDIYLVTVVATERKSGRPDSDMGFAKVTGLKGENLGNAMLKAVTKAKRRVTLSICGMGMLDETEVDDIPNSAKVHVETPDVVNPTPQLTVHSTPEKDQLDKSFKEVNSMNSEEKPESTITFDEPELPELKHDDKDVQDCIDIMFATAKISKEEYDQLADSTTFHDILKGLDKGSYNAVLKGVSYKSFKDGNKLRTVLQYSADIKDYFKKVI
jgi:hypothetical protein|tara:strand:- start:1337 stop:2239 length:903 start_codon:yes stop_codon:yes gene_type:complete